MDVENLAIAALLAQTGGETAEKAKALIAEITTWKITQATLIIAAAFLSIRLVEKLTDWLSERVAIQLRPRIKLSLPFWQFLTILAAIAATSNLFLNLSPSNVITISGTVAVALGFAFKDYASSAIAGVVVLLEATYRVGDRVRVAGHYGEITRYGLRSFQLQTLTDDTVTIPHNCIWSDAVVNTNDGELEAQVTTDFYLSHEVDTQLVSKILYQAAYTSKYTQIKLPILVAIAEMPWGTHFKLKSYPLDARAETAYKTDLSQRAKQAFANYNLPYPQLIGSLSPKS
ncbi:MAG: mechanosensitive ion channel [Cyanobacteriota bacterium]|nr:mechanosensitive ion channel [Cyanobacteriota bacterium]